MASSAAREVSSRDGSVADESAFKRFSGLQRLGHERDAAALEPRHVQVVGRWRQRLIL